MVRSVLTLTLDATPVSQLNPKKKIFETVAPGIQVYLYKAFSPANSPYLQALSPSIRGKQLG